MTDETKLSQDTARALRAEQLLGDDLLNEAFAELERAYIEKWSETAHDNQVGREKLYLAVNVARKVRDHLQTVLSNGKLAAKELADMAAEEERKRRFRIL